MDLVKKSISNIMQAAQTRLVQPIQQISQSKEFKALGNLISPVNQINEIRSGAEGIKNQIVQPTANLVRQGLPSAAKIGSYIVPGGRTVATAAQNVAKGMGSSSMDFLNQPVKGSDVLNTAGLLSAGKIVPNMVGGYVGSAIKAGENLLNKKPITTDLGDAYNQGFNYTAQLGPVEKFASWAATPALQKLSQFSPIVQTVMQKLNPSEVTGFKSLIAESLKQGNKSGLSMAVFGALQDSNSPQEALKNVWDQYKMGFAFGAGSKAAANVVPGLIKPGIQATKSSLKALNEALPAPTAAEIRARQRGQLKIASQDPLFSEAQKYKSAEEFVLPKEIPVYQEAKAIGAKRIAPDRIPHQQLTPDEGIKAMVNAERTRLQNNGNSWLKAAERIDSLIKKYGDKIPQRTEKNIQTIPGLIEDFRTYSDYKSYAPGATSLSEIKQQLIDRGNRIIGKWTPETEIKALESAKKEYVELIKKDISKGYKYPDEVLNYDPSFKKAVDARARYEKGLRTSFSSDDARIDTRDLSIIGGGTKRQDGTIIPDNQRQGIVQGVLDFSNVLGLNIPKLAKDDRWVYVHLNGKNPFLMKNAAGLYRPDNINKSVSISVGGSESFRRIVDGKEVWERVYTTTAHELGHALDHKVKNKLIDSSDLWKLKYNMNPVDGMPRGDNYWKSESEITARMIEQFVAAKKGYEQIFDQPGQWNREIYEKIIEPSVEKAINKHYSEYKIQPKSQLTDIWNKANATDNLLKETSQLQIEQAQINSSKIKQQVIQLTKEVNQGKASPSITPELFSDVETTAKAIDRKVNLLDYFRTPDRVLEKIGLKKSADRIKSAYNSYLDQLPVEIGKVTNWYEQTKTDPNSAQKLFRYLDGDKSIQLDQTQAKVAEEMRQYLNQWAEKLNLPVENRMANYMTHIFEKDFIKKEFDPELAKIIQDRIPGSVYDPFLQKRLGKLGYIEDAFRALDAYVKRATRKYYMDPALEKLKLSADTLDAQSWNYVKSYADRINLRPTEIDNLLDNAVKQSPIGYKFGQRPVTALSRFVRQAVYRGTLGFNLGSALRNLTQGVNTYAKLGEKYTGIGYMRALKEMATNGDELVKSGVLRENVIQDRQLSAVKGFMEKLDTGLFAFFNTAEKINRGSAYFGAKAKYIAEGLSEQEAIQKAVNLARDTQFSFGSVDTPVALQSDLVKTFTQFQSFNIKQTEFLSEMVKNKEFVGIIRWIGANMLVIGTAGKLLGMDLADMIPFNSILTGQSKIGETPFVKGVSDLVGAVANSPDKYGNISTDSMPVRVGNALTKSAPAFIPGGVQIKKTLEGLKAVDEQGSYSKSGKLQYPVPQDMATGVRAALFGKNNLDQAQEYFKTGATVLGDKQTAEYKKAPDKMKYYKDVMTKRKLKKLKKLPAPKKIRIKKLRPKKIITQVRKNRPKLRIK